MDEQEQSEILDESRTTDDAAYADEPDLDFPPDEPLGMDDPGANLIGDTLPERVEREEPDPLATELDREVALEEVEARAYEQGGARAVAHVAAVLDAAEAREEADEAEEVGTMVTSGDGDVAELDVEKDVVATAVGRGPDDAPSEEAAMHLMDDGT